jgi:spore germination protein KC
MLKYSNVALFKKDKLIGWLNEKESKGYNYIVGHVQSTVGQVDCPKGGRIVIELVRTDSEIKGKVKNGKPEITVDLFTEGNVGEVQCSIDLTKTETIDELNRLSAASVKDIMESAVAKAKKEGTDIFGFGEVIHRSNPKEWKKLKENWDETFKEVPVTINVDYNIRRTGTVGNSFLEEVEMSEEK